MSEGKKDLIGYMPEERGLYQDISLERCLSYLASLKGLTKVDVAQRLATLLKRFDLSTHKGKKVKELSKGMQQKAQVINTILHEPDLVIIDEPFTALDPINTQLVKAVLQELRNQGTTIIMSTHQMRQVEEMCDRILLIDDGHDVLYGELDGVRRKYSGNAVLVKTDSELPVLEGVEQSHHANGTVKLNLTEQVTPQIVLEQLIRNQVVIEKFEIAIPSLDEIFIRVVEEGDQG
jgi:ABC-2 type transport system ATP-binding protein